MMRMLLSAVILAGTSSVVLAAEATPASGPTAGAEQATAGKPDLAHAQETVKNVCSACHGMDGNSVAPVNPSIAGMPAEYITRQLTNFKSGIRVSPIMQGIAAQLTPQDMVALGVYFSQQKPKGLAAKDPALVEAGQKLYRGGDSTAGIPACASCHGPAGAGIPKNYPRLAGQYADYTLAQLKAFKAGERGNDKQGKDVNGHIMSTIASRMDESQMRAAAEYVQGLR